MIHTYNTLPILGKFPLEQEGVQGSDEIFEYFSNLGNNCVANPIARGEKNIYFPNHHRHKIYQKN